MLETKGILSTVGKTPLICLERLFPDRPIRLYAKLEGFNPGGSLKDRPAIMMLQDALSKGQIDENTTIIESSSGNLGIGLAQACAYWNLKFICVTDVRCTQLNLKIMGAYGAQIECISTPDPESGDLLTARLKRVRELLREIPNSFNCNQYENRGNPAAHFATMEEILSALDDYPDYIFCSTSTCGTLVGISEYIRNRGLPTKVIAVDARGSVIFGDQARKRLIPGHGAALMPPLYEMGTEDDFILISDLESIVGCRKLISREAILAGGSSGAVVAAIDKLKDQIEPDAVIVCILPDNGIRYLDTIYHDEWVFSQFGNIAHLWTIPDEAPTAIKKI